MKYRTNQHISFKEYMAQEKPLNRWMVLIIGLIGGFCGAILGLLIGLVAVI